MASDAGMAALTGPRDPARVRSALRAAGYKGEKIGFLSAVNFGAMARQMDVAAD
jgi:peptide/nickel transport system substrate-binding protein